MSIILTWLWQGVLLAAAIGVALRLVPRASADTRHAAWWTALAAILGIPLALVAVRAMPAGPAAANLSSGAVGWGAIVLPAAPVWADVVVAAAWTLMAAAGLLRVARRLRAARGLARRSSPFEAHREARLPLWSRTPAAARRGAQLRVSDAIDGACALGFRRPVIVVGRRLVETLDDASLDLIVLHEQAHVARRDDVLQVVQACVLAVAGWHPAVWWVSRRIDLEREAACDDYVIARTAAARQYASALLHAAAARDRGSLAVVLAAAGHPSVLRVRVARLFDVRRRRGRPRALAALGLTLPLAAVAAAPQLASLVVFVERADLVLAAPAAPAPPVAEPTPAQNRRGDSTPAERPVVERPDQMSAGRSRQAASRDAAGRPAGAPATGSGQSQALAVMPEAPPEQTQLALPSVRRHSPTLGMAAQPVALQRSPLFEALAPDTPPRRAPWEKLAASSSGTATATATAVSRGAQKGGLSLGRAFTRAGKAFAGAF
jgi:beta-lactamase regulating signal transducer with metallopeptidase domain